MSFNFFKALGVTGKWRPRGKRLKTRKAALYTPAPEARRLHHEYKQVAEDRAWGYDKNVPLHDQELDDDPLDEW